jgi:hypothetical protein
MSDRLYRLMLTHQRIDEALRRERRRRGTSPLALLRLRHRKLRAGQLITGLIQN